MKYLDLSFESPEKNLACDEVLHHTLENEGGEEVLRFWESRSPFVVLGYGNRHRSETHWKACQKDKVPVLRRISGGGTVLQGPGCLNYSLILKILPKGPSRNLKETNCFIMKRLEGVFETLLGERAVFQGDTDLTVNDLKFSGNSQKRGKNYLLFHGTFLINFNLSTIKKYLNSPSRQPAYRKNRAHSEFLVNINCSREKIKDALRQSWNAKELFKPNGLLPRIEELARIKYSSEEWNYKF